MFLDFIIVALWISKESPYHLEIHAEVCMDKMTQQGMEVGIGHNRSLLMLCGWCREGYYTALSTVTYV